MKNMYYYVYWTTNTITGMHYIGSKADHKIPVDGYGDSFSKDESDYMGSCKALKKDIKKFGKENFYKHILEKFPNEEGCRAAEGVWHDLYDVRENLKFYNETKAGKVGWVNSGEDHHGFGDIDWDGMSMNDRAKYQEIRRVLEIELEDNFVSANNFDSELFRKFKVADNDRIPDEELGNLQEMIDYVFDENLTKRESIIMKMRYGLNEYKVGNTFQGIGSCFGLTLDRIRQLHNRACQKIRFSKHREDLRQYW